MLTHLLFLSISKRTCSTHIRPWHLSTVGLRLILFKLLNQRLPSPRIERMERIELFRLGSAVWTAWWNRSESDWRQWRGKNHTRVRRTSGSCQSSSDSALPDELPPLLPSGEFQEPCPTWLHRGHGCLWFSLLPVFWRWARATNDLPRTTGLIRGALEDAVQEVGGLAEVLQDRPHVWVNWGRTIPC